MNKIDGQNLIFEQIKETYKHQGNIEDEDIRQILLDYGFSKEDKQVVVKKSIFDRNKVVKDREIIYDCPGMKFVAMGSKYMDDDKKSFRNSIKIYLSVDATHLKKTHQLLNDFLNDNHIVSNSKARNRATTDDIVMRITNRDDIAKVQEFIEKNKYIKEGMKEGNPFFARDDIGLSYASDDGVINSVNGRLSLRLWQYVTQNAGNIDGISREGFKQYLHREKTNFIKNPMDRGADINYNPITSSQERIDSLLEMSMEEDFDYDKMKYFNIVCEKCERLRIEDIIEVVREDLKHIQSEYSTEELLSSIDQVHESLFTRPEVAILAKACLTNDIVALYMRNQNIREETNKQM